MRLCGCGCGEPVTRAEYEYRSGHRQTLMDRLQSKTLVTSGGCWEYTGSRVPRGYGTIWSNDAHTKTYVHRVSWELKNGAIPEGMSVLHRCDNPPCWNPDHLWLGTHSDNMIDMVSKGRQSRSSAVLSDDAVDHIRQSSDSNAKLGLRYGVNAETVRRVKQGLTYASCGASAAKSMAAEHDLSQ